MGEPADEITSEYLKGLDLERQYRVRANAGMGWVSDKKLFVKKSMSVRVNPGDLILRGARPFHGMPEGFFDYVGWDEIEITPEMVGQKIAVFCGDEIKSKNDRVKRFQRILGESLVRMGGRWRVVKE